MAQPNGMTFNYANAKNAINMLDEQRYQSVFSQGSIIDKQTNGIELARQNKIKKGENKKAAQVRVQQKQWQWKRHYKWIELEDEMIQKMAKDEDVRTYPSFQSAMITLRTFVQRNRVLVKSKWLTERNHSLASLETRIIDVGINANKQQSAVSILVEPDAKIQTMYCQTPFLPCFKDVSPHEIGRMNLATYIQIVFWLMTNGNEKVVDLQDIRLYDDLQCMIEWTNVDPSGYLNKKPLFENASTTLSFTSLVPLAILFPFQLNLIREYETLLRQVCQNPFYSAVFTSSAFHRVFNNDVNRSETPGSGVNGSEPNKSETTSTSTQTDDPMEVDEKPSAPSSSVPLSSVLSSSVPLSSVPLSSVLSSSVPLSSLPSPLIQEPDYSRKRCRPQLFASTRVLRPRQLRKKMKL